VLSDRRAWFAALLLICSIALFAMGANLIRDENAFHANSSLATAQITSAFQNRGGPLWNVKYKFSTPDNTDRMYTGPSRMAEDDQYFSKPDVGSAVQIRYLRTDPTQNAVASYNALHWPAYLRFACGLLVLWAAFARLKAILSSRR